MAELAVMQHIEGAADAKDRLEISMRLRRKVNPFCKAEDAVSRLKTTGCYSRALLG
jgi:hypothetical protein